MERRAESEESESGRSIETMWTAVPPDDRREREHTGKYRRKRETND